MSSLFCAILTSISPFISSYENFPVTNHTLFVSTFHVLTIEVLRRQVTPIGSTDIATISLSFLNCFTLQQTFQTPT